MLSMIEQALQQLNQVAPQVAPQVTPQVEALLNVMREVGEFDPNTDKVKEFKREALQTLLGLKDKKSFVQRYLKPALEIGVIEMTIPQKPTSRLQEYRLTALGLTIRAN